MPSFGEKSRNNLNSAHPKLQELFNEVIKHYDCSVLCGFRGKEEQQRAYKDKKSSKQFPHSKHNRLPSNAVDVAPWPIEWENLKRFYYFAGFVKGVALSMGIKIRWGGDWDGDTDLDDQQLNDLPHFEIIE